MRVTIKQIAEMAGVHRSTVDKVLHDRIGVSDEVRSRVQRIIEEVGYESNMLGKALYYQKHKITIAAILLEVDALPEIRRGIEAAYHDYRDFNIEIKYYVVKYPDVEEQVDLLAMQLKKKVAGVIVSPMYHPRVQAAIDQLIAADIPVVTTNLDIKESRRLCCIGQEMEKAGRVAGRLMGVFLHHKGKVAVIISTQDLLSISERQRGFVDFIEKEEPGIAIACTVETREDPIVAFQKTIELLKAERELDALFITCGCVSEICRAVKAAGREDITIVSFERYAQIEALLREGTITCTISSDLVAQGYQAVKVLFEYFMYRRLPEGDIYPAIDILLKENL